MLSVVKAEFSKTLIEIKTYYPDHIVDVFIKFFLFLTFFIGFGQKNISTDLFCLGYSFWMIASYIISEASESISYEKQVGTIEQIFIKPFQTQTILIVRSLMHFCVSLFKFILLYILVLLILKVQFSLKAQILVVYAISIIGFLGVGIFLSALTLIFTKTASFEAIVSYALLGVSGVIIPFDKMPQLLGSTLKVFPYFYQIDMAQRISLNNSAMPLDWIILLLSNLAMCIVGFVFFNLCARHVRNHGLINKY